MSLPARPALIVLAPLLACACLDRALPDPIAAAETGDDGSEPNESETGEPEPSADLPPEPAPFDCAAACASPVDGSCLVGDACVDYCAGESPGWPAEVREAFAACVATNPMCFMSAEHCLLQALYEQGTAFPLTLTGVGFDAYEGLEIEVWHDPQVAPSFTGTAVISDGGFTLAWVEPVAVTADYGPLLLAFVDLDGDQACTAADLATMVTLAWNGDLLAPGYAAELSPPAETNEFVCGLQP